MALGPLIGRAAIGIAAKAALSGDDEDEDAEVSQAVSSSAISRISYKDEVITVTFHRGGTYDYPGSRALYNDFVSAPSIGSYFNAHIRSLG